MKAQWWEWLENTRPQKVAQRVRQVAENLPEEELPALADRLTLELLADPEQSFGE